MTNSSLSPFIEHIYYLLQKENDTYKEKNFMNIYQGSVFMSNGLNDEEAASYLFVTARALAEYPNQIKKKTFDLIILNLEEIESLVVKSYNNLEMYLYILLSLKEMLVIQNHLVEKISKILKNIYLTGVQKEKAQIARISTLILSLIKYLESYDSNYSVIFDQNYILNLLKNVIMFIGSGSKVCLYHENTSTITEELCDETDIISLPDKLGVLKFRILINQFLIQRKDLLNFTKTSVSFWFHKYINDGPMAQVLVDTITSHPVFIVNFNIRNVKLFLQDKTSFLLTIPRRVYQTW